MSTTVLPELAADSVATTERLVRLSAATGIDATETDYILASALNSMQSVARLWRIVRKRVGAGTTSDAAKHHLTGLLDAVDRNVSLAEALKQRDPEAVEGLAAAEKQLHEIRADAVRLLGVIDAPARWPGAEQLREAREHMRAGDRLTAEEFRQTLLDE